MVFFYSVLKEITPQLFARLSCHPEQVVRRQLETLLVMLAKLSPWSIVYPALVDANTQEKEISEELQQILACLVRQNILFLTGVSFPALPFFIIVQITICGQKCWQCFTCITLSVFYARVALDEEVQIGSCIV